MKRPTSIWLTAFFVLLSGTAFAQVDDVIRAAHLSSAYASIINFSAEPDVSSSKLWVDKGTDDELQMRITKFPLRHEFKLKNHAWKPVVQGTLGRLKLNNDLIIDPDNRVESEWKSYSATLGGGIRFPLSKDWSILPAVDAGYAHLENEATYIGPVSTALQPLLSGKLFDWTADAWLVNGHLALFYEHQFGNFTVNAHGGGTIGYIESYDSTHEIQEFSETVGSFNLKIDCAHPLGFAIAGDPISIVGHLGNNTILTDMHTSIDTSSIYETGLLLQADIARHGIPIKKVGLGGMFLWGENVIGWSIKTTYRF